MTYTLQPFTCCVCGKDEPRKLTGAWHDRVCSRRCHYEFEWRKTLSIMGKEYYPDPRAYTDDGDPIT